MTMQTKNPMNAVELLRNEYQLTTEERIGIFNAAYKEYEEKKQLDIYQALTSVIGTNEFLSLQMKMELCKPNPFFLHLFKTVIEAELATSIESRRHKASRNQLFSLYLKGLHEWRRNYDRYDRAPFRKYALELPKLCIY